MFCFLSFLKVTASSLHNAIASLRKMQSEISARRLANETTDATQAQTSGESSNRDITDEPSDISRKAGGKGGGKAKAKGKRKTKKRDPDPSYSPPRRKLRPR